MVTEINVMNANPGRNAIKWELDGAGETARPVPATAARLHGRGW